MDFRSKIIGSLRWHDPNQVSGSKSGFLSARKGLPNDAYPVVLYYIPSALKCKKKLKKTNHRHP